MPATVPGRGPVVADARQVEVGELADEGRGVRALRRQQRDAVAAVLELGAEVAAREERGELGDHGLAIRGVADDPEPVLRASVDDEVVDDPAVGLAGHRVLRLADLERARVADQGVAQEGDGLLAGHLDLAHVRQVEQADRRSAPSGAPR